MYETQKETTSPGLAECIAALSVATDLGMGQPLEYALQVCLLATRLGDALGLSEHELREVYYLALLRHIGCNAETSVMAALFGDELVMRAEVARADEASMPEMVQVITRTLRQTQSGASPFGLARMIAQAVMTGPQIMREEYRGFCEVAQRLAQRLGFDESLLRSLGQVFQRWDGRGVAGGIKGEAIAFPMRIVSFAQDAVTFHRLGGVAAVTAMASERKGQAYDPVIVERFCQQAPHLFAGFEEESSWEAIVSLEPGTRLALSEVQFDNACQVMADFADLKSPYTLGHSRAVAELAASAARRCGLSEHEVTLIRRAGLLQDVGRIGISAGIWGKPGPLTQREWEQVRMHPYYTGRILARPATLAQLGQLATLHHERLDSSGYHRGLPAMMLPPAARILASADVYQALIEPRPHRRALSPEAAVDEIQRDVHAGGLDGSAVQGVLAAAGHRMRPGGHAFAAGLSAREIEVLQLVARGQTIKQIARSLTLAEKTVDNHIQHIYIKIGVSTRAGATLFAIEQQLLSPET